MKYLNNFFERTNGQFTTTSFEDILFFSDFWPLVQTIGESNSTVNNLDIVYIPFFNETVKAIDVKYVADSNTFGLFFNDHLFVENQTLSYNVAMLGNNLETVSIASYIALNHHFKQFSYDILKNTPDMDVFNSNGLEIEAVTRDGFTTLHNKTITTYNEHINAHADIMDAFVK